MVITRRSSFRCTWRLPLKQRCCHISSKPPTHHSKQTMLGFGPRLSWNVAACLATQRSAITRVHNAALINRGHGLGTSRCSDVGAVSWPRVTLAATPRWFCFQGSCPVVAESVIVFVDGDHTTKRVVPRRAPVRESAVTPLLE